MTEPDRTDPIRNDGAHDDVIPGPTDDTYKHSHPVDVDQEEAADAPSDREIPDEVSPDEKAAARSEDDDPGERRFDYS